MPVNEMSELSPKWPHPRSKELAERVVLGERGDMPVVILRIAGVDTNQGEVPSLTLQMQRIYERQWSSHLFPGNPAHGQSFVHLDDLSDAVQRAVTRRAELPHCTTLLIGEPVAESLIAGLAMLIRIPYSFDELLASLQYLRSRTQEGKSMLRALLFGGTCDGDACDRTDDFDRPARQVMRDILRGGVTFPWTLWVSIAIGTALMSCYWSCWPCHVGRCVTDMAHGIAALCKSTIRFVRVCNAEYSICTMHVRIV